MDRVLQKQSNKNQTSQNQTNKKQTSKNQNSVRDKLRAEFDHDNLSDYDKLRTEFDRDDLFDSDNVLERFRESQWYYGKDIPYPQNPTDGNRLADETLRGATEPSRANNSMGCL